MWIERALSKRLAGLAQQFPALLLTGARQTGKTSLLRREFPRASFVSLDLPSLAEQADGAPHEFLLAHPSPVILDEVQYAPGLFRHLKAAIDHDRHDMGRYLMTGSQKFPLMKSLADSLAGRCALLELDSLSGQEIRRAFKKDAPSLKEVLWRGGFPELYRNLTLSPTDFYHAYLSSYLERDVRALLRIGSLRDFERFLRACALRSGQLLNLADLAKDVGIAGTTARDWISVLEASEQILLVEPYFNNFGKRMIKTPKLYFADTGLLCFLLGIDTPAGIDRSPFAGALWEAFVFGQIHRAKYAAGSSAEIYFWRDAHGTEVDFVIEHQGRLRLVEAKWSEEDVSSKAAAIEKVRPLLGNRAAIEHWIVCRTPHERPMAGHSTIRLLNGFTHENWFSED